MLKFGYRNKLSAPLRAVVLILIGVLMVVFRTDAMELLVKIIAAFMLAAGVVSFFVAFKQKNDGTMPLSTFNGVTDIVIALLLFLFAGVISKFLSYLVAIALLCFGFFQITALLSARAQVRAGFGAYVIPVAVTLVGLFILLYPTVIGQSIGLIAGISLVLAGASELYSAYKFRNIIDSEDSGPDEQ